MPKYLIRNHYRYKQLIRYDSETGEFSDVDYSSLSDDERKPRPGAWARVGGELYGVCLSPDGPVFFHNEERFPLVQGAVATTVDDAGDQRHFTLTNGGECVVDVTFTRDPELEFDLYEGGANEFFEWFHYLHGKPIAWDLFTRKTDAA